MVLRSALLFISDKFRSLILYQRCNKANAYSRDITQLYDSFWFEMKQKEKKFASISLVSLLFGRSLRVHILAQSLNCIHDRNRIARIAVELLLIWARYRYSLAMKFENSYTYNRRRQDRWQKRKKKRTTKVHRESPKCEWNPRAVKIVRYENFRFAR